MKRNIIFVAAAAAALVIAALFVLWPFTQAPKKKAAVPKKAALPAVKKKFARAKVAIVMDDFGYNMNNLDTLFACKEPVTLSILPNLAYSKRIAHLAGSKGYEIMLHLPLEANDSAAPAEAGTIKTAMDEKEVVAMLEKDLRSVPGIKGISNHQGSKATEDRALMTTILAELKKKNLYFFDSLVTDRSVCRGVARDIGVPYAKRDMFLDNVNSQDYIEKQVLGLRRFAFRKGSAIAVCHDRKNTIAVLNRLMGELAADGIVFVRLSEMVK